MTFTSTSGSSYSAIAAPAAFFLVSIAFASISDHRSCNRLTSVRMSSS
jgi:uncharacterized membrane protein